MPQAHVIDGRKPHSLLLEMFTDEGIGTMVRARTRRAQLGAGMTHGASRSWTATGPRSSRSSACRRRVLSHGDGCYVVDVDGKRYLDLLGGIAVNTLGHGHPALVEAVTKQASQVVHVSNFFTSEPQVELAERLLQVCRRARRFRGVLRQLRARRPSRPRSS